MSIRTVNCFVGAFAVFAAIAVPIDGYVANGLVGQWDGIDNAGTGTHDPAATSWKDLTGFTGDGTLASSVKWDGNCWTNGVDCRPVTVGGAFATVMSTGCFTLEYTLRPTRKGSRETLLGGYKSPATGTSSTTAAPTRTAARASGSTT